MDTPERQDPRLEELDEARRGSSRSATQDPEKVFAWFPEDQKRYADRRLS